MIPILFNFALLLEKEQPHRAIAIYRFMVTTFPKDPNSFYRLALLAFEANEETEAIQWVIQLLRERPNDDGGYAILARILHSFAAKDPSWDAQVMQVFKNQSERTVAIGVAIGIVYLEEAQRSERIGHVDVASIKAAKALDRFRHALSIDKGNVLAAHGAACCIALKGQIVNASGLFERVAEAQCNTEAPQLGIQSHVFNSLVLTRAYRKALAQLNKTDFSRAELSAMGCCHALLGEYDTAVRQLAAASPVTASTKEGGHCDYNYAIVLILSVLSETSTVASLTDERAQELTERLKRATMLEKRLKGLRFPPDGAELFKRLLAQVTLLRVPEVIANLRKRNVALETRLSQYDNEWRMQASQYLEKAEDHKKQQVLEEQERIERKRQNTAPILERMRDLQRRFSQHAGFDDDEIPVAAEEATEQDIQMAQSLREAIGDELVDGIHEYAEAHGGEVAPPQDAQTMIEAFGSAALEPTLLINQSLGQQVPEQTQ